MKIIAPFKKATILLAFTILSLNGYAQLPKSATNQNQVLPVSLISFNLKTEKPNEIIVNWSTASEINSSRFIIEASKDGDYFYQIEVVNAAGDSNMFQNYQFIIRDVASIKFGIFPLFVLLLIPNLANRRLKIAIFSLVILSILSCKKENEPEPTNYYIRLMQIDRDGKKTDLGIKSIKVN